MPQVSLFISCVSNEFAHYRDAMRRDFARPNLTAKIQEDFYAGGMPTLQKLDEYIRNCDAVIHLCGDMTGSLANPVSLEYIKNKYPDFATRFPALAPIINGEEQLSYTQWEAWLAAYHKKILLIAKPTQEAPRHSTYRLDAGQQHQQEQHIGRLRKHGSYDEIKFSTTDELIKELYRSSLLELFAKLPKTKPINLPYHSIGDLFKGREDEMNKLFNSLTAAHSQPAAIIGNTIHGLGGIGKTRMAVEYAWRHEEDYTALLFVTADTPEKLYSGIASLSGKMVLDLSEKDEQEERVRYEAVISWLQQYHGWLLILDNADTKAAAEQAEALFDRELRGGHVLITSRQSHWSKQVSPLMLDVLDDTAAASFLLRRTDGERRKTAEDEKLALQIAEDLGYLALALEQAGAYISTRRLTLSQYYQAWRTKHDEVLKWYDARLMKYPSSVAVTWQTSVEQLSADARLLLDRLAWLAPDPIPESLMDTKAAEEDSFDYYAALTELSDYSLVSRSDDEPEFTVHRLVQFRSSEYANS